jgi:hypothetical protein
MVKNLPTVERSTKIRFGKNVPDSTDQEENTIVFNASNVSFDVSNPGAVYLSPVRERIDYSDPNVVLLMYDRITKEITESGESATDIIEPSLASATQFGNVTSNTIVFTGSALDAQSISIITSNSVGVVNTSPQNHTLSVGSNLYVHDTGSNVLVVSGNVAILRDLVIDGNLTVNGGTTVIITENLSVGDAIIEIGRNNTSEDTTLDLGLLMHRPETESNVIIGFRESSNEFAIAYTEASPHDKTFTPKTDEDINVHVYGLTHVDANIYAHEDLLVTGNVYVSGNVSITEELTVSNNVYADKDLEVMGNVYVDGNVVAYKDLLVSGNVYVSTNVDITEELTVTGNVYADKDLEVMGNLYVDGNVTIDSTTLHVDVESNRIGLGTTLPGYTLDVRGTSNVGVLTSPDVTITDGTHSTSKDTGALIVSNGGLGVEANIHSTNIFALSHITVGTSDTVYALDVRGTSNVGVLTSPDATITDGTHSTSKDTGALIVSNGGLGVEANIHSTNVFAVSHIGVGTSATSNTFDVRGTANVGALVTTSTHVSDSTQSTSTTTGALQVTGGVGIQGEVHSSNIFSASDTDGKSILGRVALGSLGVSGTSDQAAFSHIDMASASNFAVKQSALGTTHVNAKSGQHIRLSIGASEKARLTSDGDFYVNTDTLYVDASESRIGIKTISPGQPLDVRGAANVGVLTVTSGSVTDVTHSTSKDTGVLVITRGGLGVESNIHSTNVFATSHIGIGTSATSNTFDVRGTANVGALVATSTHISDSTGATSKSSGALQVTGGVGIQGDLYATHANLEDVEADSITVTDATHSTSKDTGALIITHGGLGVEANIHATNVFVTSHIGVGTSATSNTFDVRGTANVGALVSTSTHISDSTAASSKSSGALRVKGGTGIQGALHAADTTLDSVKPLNISTGTIPFTDAGKKLIDSIITQDTGGNISISGNVEITGNISVLGNSFSITSSDLIINDRIIDIANNNVSTTLDVGILMEHPDKNIFIGHHTSPHDHFSIGYTDAGYSADQVEWTGTDHITANVWGHLITQNTVTVQYGNVYIVDGGLGIGIGDGENDDVPDSKLYVTGNAHFTSNISTASNVLITGIATATSKTTGALQVTGGVGISGDIYATDANLENVEADSVTVTDNSTSTTKDTGALIVSNGGVGIEENLNVGGFTKVWDNSTSTTTTSGALKVVGGVGIVENLNVGGFTKVWDDSTSTTTTSGALKVVGGVGIVENLNVGGDLKVDTSVLVVNSTTNRVGINKATPGYALDVDGDINFTGTFREDGVPFVSTPWTIETTPDALSYIAGNVGIGEATPDATLHVTGNAYVTTNLFASNVYTSGGLITNTAGTAKKTYSHTGTLPNNATIANGTFGIVFSNHVFQAKIYAVLVEGTVTVSSITQDCCGGHITGGTPATITLGSTNVIGHSGYPWDTVVASNGTTVTIKAKQILVGAGNYNIFVEYLSAHTGGRVLKFTEGGSDEIVFNY